MDNRPSPPGQPPGARRRVRYIGTVRRSRAILGALALAVLLAGLVLWLRSGARRAAEEVARPGEPVAGAERPGPPERVPRLPIHLEPPPAGDSLPAPHGALSGRVVSRGTGEGIPGAELTFSRAGAAASTRSGPRGLFRFEPPAAGLWRLAAATAAGHLPFAPEWEQSPVEFAARPGAPLEGVVVTLDPAVGLRGLVLSPEAKPVAGAEVRLLGAASGESALLPLPGRFVSGPDGTFAFAAREGALLEARAAGYAPARAELDFAARVSGRLVLRLGPARGEPAPREAIGGRVVGPGGAPVEGALVTARFLFSQEPESDLHPSAQAVSGPDGRFLLADLDPGAHVLRAARQGFAPGRLARVQTGRTDAELVLSAGGRLEGTVRERGTGRPVAPFTVHVTRGRGPSRSFPLASRAFLDPEGRFEMGDLPAGQVRVAVIAPAHAPSEPVEVEIPEPPGGPGRLDVLLSAGGRIVGQVLDRETRRPIPGASVEVEGQPEPAASVVPSRAEATADADGHFVLAGVPSRPLSLFASAPAHHARILSGLHVADGGELGPVTIELSPTGEGEDPRVELAGIGAVLAQRGDALRIVEVNLAGGAAEAGLAAGDDVVTIEGRPVRDLGFADAIQRIRGPEGSTIQLGVRRGRDGPVREIWVPRRLVRG